MGGKRQFSLGYLFLEIFWIAVALGTTRFIVLDWYSNQSFAAGILLPVAIVLWTTVIGGLFGLIRLGALCGVATLVVMTFFLPQVRT